VCFSDHFLSIPISSSPSFRRGKRYEMRGNIGFEEHWTQLEKRFETHTKEEIIFVVDKLKGKVTFGIHRQMISFEL